LDPRPRAWRSTRRWRHTHQPRGADKLAGCWPRPSRSEHRTGEVLEIVNRTNWVEDTRNPPSQHEPGGQVGVAQQGCPLYSNSWRVAVDYAGSDSRGQTFLQNVSRYVDSKAAWPVSLDKNSAFLAVCLSGMAVSQARPTHISTLAVRHHGRHALLPGLAARAVPPLGESQFSQGTVIGG